MEQSPGVLGYSRSCSSPPELVTGVTLPLTTRSRVQRGLILLGTSHTGFGHCRKEAFWAETLHFHALTSTCLLPHMLVHAQCETSELMLRAPVFISRSKLCKLACLERLAEKYGDPKCSQKKRELWAPQCYKPQTGCHVCFIQTLYAPARKILSRSQLYYVPILSLPLMLTPIIQVLTVD